MVVVAVSGDVDLRAAPGLAAVLVPELGVSPRVVVDLLEVSFIDSSGLSVVAQAAAEGRAHGNELALVVGGGQVRKVLDVTGLSDVIPVFAQTDEARSFLVRGRPSPL